MTWRERTATAAGLAVSLFLIGCAEQPTQVRTDAEDVPYPLAAKALDYEGATGSGQPAPNSAGGASVALAGPSLLLLADVDGPSTTALANALGAAGNVVTLRPAPEFTWDATNPSLDGFACVVHLNGLTFGTPLSSSAQQALVDFVSSGGGFVASQWNGFELTIGQQTTMADLVLQRWADAGTTENCGGCNITYTTVSGQESHPVLAGIPSPFTFFADGHDAGTQVVFASDPSTVLTTVTAGGPAVLVREFDQGRVVNFSHAANFGNFQTLLDPTIQQLYTNAADWVCGPLQVDIDIKPGSDPNSINLGNKGGIPVAILTTDDFDAADVDASTVTLGNDDGNDTSVATRKNGSLKASLEDVDDDGDLDLILHFDTQALVANGDLDANSTELILNGATTGGQPIEGSDSVNIVPAS